jgi:hypothetical protein
MRKGIMRSVTVRLRADEFSASMTAIGEWLDANRYPAGVMDDIAAPPAYRNTPPMTKARGHYGDQEQSGNNLFI